MSEYGRSAHEGELQTAANSRLGQLFRNSMHHSDAEARSSYKRPLPSLRDDSPRSLLEKGSEEVGEEAGQQGIVKIPNYYNVPPTPDSRTILRSRPFIFTPPSREEKRFRRCRRVAKASFIVYLVILTVFAWVLHLDKEATTDTPRVVFYSFLLLAANILLVFPLFSLAI